jgi:hypothetical protein
VVGTWIEERPGEPGALPSVGGLGGHFGAPHESELPVLIPGRLGAHAFPRDRNIDQVRSVPAGDSLHTPPQGRLELLHGRDGFAVHALRTGEGNVVSGGCSQINARIASVADHLAIRNLARPVVADDLVALVMETMVKTAVL